MCEVSLPFFKSYNFDDCSKLFSIYYIIPKRYYLIPNDSSIKRKKKKIFLLAPFFGAKKSNKFLLVTNCFSCFKHCFKRNISVNQTEIIEKKRTLESKVNVPSPSCSNVEFYIFNFISTKHNFAVLISYSYKFFQKSKKNVFLEIIIKNECTLPFVF